MSLRARFFDDWRLSRIDEEVDRLSVNSETSAVEVAASLGKTSSAFAAQRSSSADGTLETVGDDDDVGTETERGLTGVELGDSSGKLQELQHVNKEGEALRFLQAKYDTLGKVKVERPRELPTERDRSAVENLRFCGCGSAEVRTQADQNRLPTNFEGLSLSDKSSDSLVTCSTGSRSHPAETHHHHQHNRQCCCSHEPSGRSHHQHPHQDHVGERRREQESEIHISLRLTQPPQDAGAGTRYCRHHQQQVDCQRRDPQQLSLSQDHRSADQRQRPQQQQQVNVVRHSPLTAAETFQIDLFYRSRKTLVYVSSCASTLYFTTRVASTGPSGQPSAGWYSATSGVPVALLDLGTSDRARRGRLYIVLAERGTGFELWRHPIDRLDQYAVTTSGATGSTSAFHTILLTSGDDAVRRAGLCFDDPLAAGEFQRQLFRLGELDETSLNSLTGNQKGKKKKSRTKTDELFKGKSTRKRNGKSAVSKSDISQPCCFTHVTRLQRGSSINHAAGRSSALTGGISQPSTSSLDSHQPTTSGILGRQSSFRPQS